MECGKVMFRYKTPKVAACKVWDESRHEIKSTFRGVYPFGGRSTARLEMIWSISVSIRDRARTCESYSEPPGEVSPRANFRGESAGPPPLGPWVEAAPAWEFHYGIPTPSPSLAHCLVHGDRCNCGSNSCRPSGSASTPGIHHMGSKNPGPAFQGARACARGARGFPGEEMGPRACPRMIAQFLRPDTYVSQSSLEILI